ncbi:hypothetical protein N7489_011078 [Penicillium chrysogenum]|uniref:Uncharacterized protein n=1 Tax=Penicillium chrysogenum TaxID=5076 RepID=A0ABQ8WCD7_PENCH|nr:uncharacterized protein N7489_011078 [Penicillium chrysogenum]XP_061070397.1 uncharacterized protein N7525_005360 [Penicillium rubens]KAJ5230370.1 hypothetical protein N7489_011078 [Penicillium chrysogenum]KAJ5264214.1 hypothetical protein N7505_008135 [Penicillium chrysogenum]KAJ5272045.1 hypothetical protein N7524_005314 [Penicillium chrysogenum]KAJ5840172.1 hypothetical protein N7525_005360 [Penicillium rubens]KAJ6163400.1 hypothetical protein N7497_003379 [Penicillium chrysogenum]
MNPIISPHAKDPVSGEMRTVITVHVCGPAGHRCENPGEAMCAPLPPARLVRQVHTNREK